MRITKDIVALEKKRYPSLEDAVSAINGVYRDKWPNLVSETAQERVFEISDPFGEHAYRDPLVDEICRQLWGFGVDRVPEFRQIWNGYANRPISMISLQNTWALWLWSLWLQAGRGHARKPILLIHIDSHDDLEEPPLCVSDSGDYASPVGKAAMSVFCPATIPEFVLRGFIGIGGFIVPLVHSVRIASLIHVYPSRSDPPSRVVTNLRRTRHEFEVLGSPAIRPGLEQAPRPDVETLEYVLSSDASILSSIAGDEDILLDIDMDYFCNRFDDKAEFTDRMSATNVLNEMQQMFERIRSSGWSARIQAASFALSPGFFPSEYWPTVLPEIKRFIQSLPTSGVVP